MDGEADRVTVEDRCRAVLDRVGAAAERAKRRADDVTVVAAAKGACAQDVRRAVAAGIRDVGESYVQERRRSHAAIDAPGIRWHFIGRLQRNKATAVVDLFGLIHSLDSLELAKAIDRAAGRIGLVARCLIEVNVGDEKGKGGVSSDDAEALWMTTESLSHVSIEGLMAIPPAVDADRIRPFFGRLRDLRDRLARLRPDGAHLKELSMGMSGDFEVAIEEGATLVRVGTALFGPRPS